MGDVKQSTPAAMGAVAARSSRELPAQVSQAETLHSDLLVVLRTG